MSFIIKKRGFTLLEILVALAVGSIVAIGTLKMFKDILYTRSMATNNSNSMLIAYKVISLMERDIRCKIGPFQVSYSYGLPKLSFKTTDSLVFGGSIPVKVSYYLVRDNGKTYLVREETNKKALEDMTIYLTSNFNNMRFKFYSNGIWSDNPSSIIKVYLYSKHNKEYVFSCRGVLNE